MQESLLVNKTKYVRLFLIRRFILLVTLLVSNPFYSWQDPTISLPNRSSVLSRAANCTPATGRKFLEFNNVSALIETGGSMWQDRSRNDAAYEVPKGSNETVIYAGALSGGIAFTLQMFAQKNIEEAPAAIIYSLEGVFAAIAGWIILNQFLTTNNMIGCFLILVAVISSQISPSTKT